jgi:periplasmic protein CpxP/Spy
MEKSRFVTLLAIGLLLSNLMLVGFIMVNRSRHLQGERMGPPPPHERGPRNIIIQRLHLTEAQVSEYDKLIKWHRDEIDREDKSLSTLKQKLYNTLTTPTDSTEKDSIFAAISQAQQHIERIHYKHFEDIRALCTEQQKPDFEALTQEIASLFGPRPHKRP